MKIGIIGAGGWGTALAVLLHSNGHTVKLWAYREEDAQTILEQRENITFLPGVHIPKRIRITTDLEKAIFRKNLIVTAVPTQYLRSVMESLSNKNFRNRIIVNVAKGIEKGSMMTGSEILLDVLKRVRKQNVAVLSGPSHAEEVSRKVPTAVVASSFELDTAKVARSVFLTPYFRVYHSGDIKGVELGGSLKNIIAIGAGICDGAQLGDNTKAAIMTRGLAEIARLGVALGAQFQTFAGLSGMGDLIVTCMSRHSRNRYVGEQIGKGRKIEEIIGEMKMVAEGVDTTRSAHDLSKKHFIDTPIITELYRVLFEDKDPIQATHDLMNRDAKAEVWG
jgi:glycerol-3-phosphate dehydrogenase (NAD(P)+)